MDRELFLSPALEVAPRLLGAALSVTGDDGTGGIGTVTIRVTEVEAYHGVGTPGPYDPGSHSKDRRTARNASMFGPPGHAYVYFSYGMHFALNLVCSPEGTASGVLIRAGEVVAGHAIAQRRRAAKRGGAPVPERMLARGPGNVAAALGIARETHDGLDLFAAPFALEAPPAEPDEIASGPRVGVAGEAGGDAFPWRFWIPGEGTVSAFRPGRGAQPFIATPRRQ
ncbi:DNA-3-methyladenine glycosylase [Leucobacter tenebrionis]|uniref:DNA-3-methyladenine glycosylase n=1 Tax=Leucobacter tenebrionis TaxID=2873270 RepID=UPI001CA7A3E0|nr:DNA-3-methyladenine glycosylase [Leucobacter tenebrionis]QZY52168.1 DNA-3-methyladenine glycosylase [Leucobacter tenebrionis]